MDGECSANIISAVCLQIKIFIQWTDMESAVNIFQHFLSCLDFLLFLEYTKGIS